jgi:small GTP-binding protein
MMPTNLPPEYYKAEDRYRAAQTTPEKIACLEEMMSTIPKHKGTDKLRADLRRKIAKMRETALSQKGGARQISPYYIDREGAGQVALIGPANSGKSSLINALTNASPDVAAYPYTTHTPVPGMMAYENIQIQLIDTPPLGREYDDPQLLDLIRRVDAIVLVVDIDAPLQQIEECIAILEAHHIVPEHRVVLYEHIERRLFIKPMLVLVNKIDTDSEDEDFAVLCELLHEENPDQPCPLMPASANALRHLDKFKQALFDALGIVRVFSQPPGEKANFNAPFVLKRGSTVADFAGKVHKDFLEGLKSARIWGEGVYDGQPVGRDHVLHDGDVVELRA